LKELRTGNVTTGTLRSWIMLPLFVFLLKILAKCLFDFLIVYDIIIGSNK